MKRKILLLMFILVFLATDDALARRHRWRNRCCPTKCCFVDHEQPKSTHYCLRDVFMEFPSPPHLYECLVKEGGCENPTDEYEDLWFGYPMIPLAQSCPNCESGGWRGQGGPAPGHGKNLLSFGRAQNWLKDGHYSEPGPTPAANYHELTIGSETYCFVMIRARHVDGLADDRYFGVETEDLTTSPTALPSVSNPVVRGMVLSFKATIEGTADQKALIWLKRSRER